MWRLSAADVDVCCATGTLQLQVFESWGGELSKDHFEEFCLPYLARIAKEVKANVLAASAEDPALPSRIPMTVFARNAHHALEGLAETQYDVISLDWCVRSACVVERLSS